MAIDLHIFPSKGRYSDSLRDMFQKINPYNLSCLYKENFEAHAVETLLSCDGTYPRCGCLHDTTSRVSGVKHARSPDICKATTCRTDIDTGTERSRRGSDLFSMEYFYQEMSLLANENMDSCSDVSGWQVCGRTHVSSLDNILKHFREPAPTYKRRQSSAGKQNCMTAIRRSRHLNGNQSNSSICRNLSYPSSFSEEIVSKLLDSRWEKPSNSTSLKNQKAAGHCVKSETISTVKKRHSHATKSAGTVHCHVESESESSGSFQHDQPRSQYMEQYRRHSQKSPQNAIILDKSSSRSGMPISKARVHCQDVRSGACIQPALKIAQFQFKVNCRWRTVSMKKGKKSKRPVATPPSPFMLEAHNIGPANGVSAMPDLQDLRIASPGLGSPSNNMTVCSPSPPITHTGSPGPVVCRSRPSIPSNARGVVCDTAVEMPPHVINCVKGHSINSKYSTSDKSKGLLMSYLDEQSK